MTAKIKLNAASGGGSISIQAPSSSSNNRVISLPDIADGTLVTSTSTLDATKLSGNLPAISGAALTNLPAGGISDFDTWYITSSVQGNQLPIANNWSRWTSAGGTGSVTFAAPSSGIWTFPSTGYWLIDFEAATYTSNAAQRGVNSYLYVTTNNSSYSFAAQQSTNHYNSGDETYGHTRLGYILDVTDTSNVKIKLQIGYQTSVTYLRGHGSYLYTNVKFFKLKDT